MNNRKSRAFGSWISALLTVIVLALVCIGLVLPASAERSDRDMRERGEVVVEPSEPVEDVAPADLRVTVTNDLVSDSLMTMEAGTLAAGTASPPGFPSSFYGTTKLGGQNVAAGLPVSAWIDGVKVSETDALIWEGNSVSASDVLEKDTTGRGGTDGDTVRFRIGGTWANQTATWISGTITNVDLAGPAYSTAFSARAMKTDDFTVAAGWPSQELEPRTLADVNGDGRDKQDIVGFTEQGTVVALSNGITYLETSRWLYDFGINQGWTSQNEQPRMLGDIDGDGKSDIVGFTRKGTYVALSTGSAFGAKSRWIPDFGSLWGWVYQNTKPRLVGDVNGDGRADIVAFAGRKVYVALSEGTSFAPKTAWLVDFCIQQGWTSQEEKPRMLADVNGDGKDDIIGFTRKGAYVALSTGTRFTAKSRWLADFGSLQGWTSQDANPRLVADANGDGRADIIGFANKKVYVALSNGSRFNAAVGWLDDLGVTQGWTSQNTTPRLVGDFYGDGRSDITAFGTGKTSVCKSE